MNSRYILEVIEKEFGGISISEKKRINEYAYPRFVYFKLCKEFTNESLYCIGRNIDRDHATVINGVKRFKANTKPFVKEKFKPFYQVYLRLKSELVNIDLDYTNFREPANLYEEELEAEVKLKYEKQLIKIMKKHAKELEKQRVEMNNQQELFKNQETVATMDTLQEIVKLPMKDVFEFERLAKVFYKRKMHEKMYA